MQISKKGILLIVFLWAPLLLACLSIGWVILFLNTRQYYGYIDRTGHFAIPPRFNYAESFNNGKAFAYLPTSRTDCNRDYQVVLDRKGNYLPGGDGLSPCLNYSIAYPTNLKPSFLIDDDQYPSPVFDEKYTEGWVRFGYQDMKRQWVIPPRFAFVTRFNRGIAWVAIVKSHNYYWGLIDTKGNYIMAPKCLAAGSFHEDLAPCKTNVYFGRFYWDF